MKKTLLLFFMFSVSVFATDWPMYHYDLARTGYTVDTGPTTSTLKWTFTTGNTIPSSPAVVDGVVYVGNTDSELHAVNATDGSYIWNYTVGNQIETGPAVAGGRVFFSSYDDKIWALNTSTGTHLWNFTTNDDLRSSPLVSNEVVYIGSDDGKLYALNASTGVHLWNYSTGNFIRSAPSTDGEKVYVTSYAKKVFAINISGNHTWNYTVETIGRNTAIFENGVVYLADSTELHAINASNGSGLWNITIPDIDDVSFCDSAVAEGRLFVGTTDVVDSDPRVYAFNITNDGSELWHIDVGAQVLSTPAVADGRVYFGSNDGRVYAVNATSGSHIWNYSIGSAVQSSPAIVGGIVYVGSANNKLYAFGPSSETLCGDSYDNDGDGLIDCADPDCDGYLGCVGNVVVVVPEFDFPTIFFLFILSFLIFSVIYVKDKV